MGKKKKAVGDQITTKFHNYVKNLAVKVQEKLHNKGFTISEIALYDVMAKLLQDRFDKVMWTDEKSVDRFVEEIMNHLEDLKKSKDVNVKYRMRFPKK